MAVICNLSILITWVDIGRRVEKCKNVECAILGLVHHSPLLQKGEVIASCFWLLSAS